MLIAVDPPITPTKVPEIEREAARNAQLAIWLLPMDVVGGNWICVKSWLGERRFTLAR